MYENSRLKLVIVSVAITAVALLVLSTLFFYERETSMIKREFQNDVDERASAIYKELLINFETLRSLAILFNGDTLPEFARFKIEASRILSRHDDVQALEWIPKISHSKRASFIAESKKLYPNYQLKQRNAQGDMTLAKQREHYFPVSFVVPLKGNEPALGFDLSSSLTRLTTLEKSRDTGLALATASITLVQEKDKQKGFLAFLPIYRNYLSNNIQVRRANLLGFVLGVYRIKDIFNSSGLINKVIGIQMTLVDNTLQSSPEILYQHQPLLNSAIYDGLTYRKNLPEIWGREWGLVAKPTVAYIESRRSMLPQIVFATGFGIIVIVIWYVITSIQRTAFIQSIVTQKTDELRDLNYQLELLSRSDELTGIANRRRLDEMLEIEWSRALRSHSPLSFILIDIDFFKQYNDNYGHLKGDECLKEVASALSHVPRRSSDLVARYGGEEFALILADTDDGEFVAEKCCQVIRDLAISHHYSGCADIVTISAGVCTCQPTLNSSSHHLIDAADKALYQSKNTGRDKVSYTKLNDVIPLH